MPGRSNTWACGLVLGLLLAAQALAAPSPSLTIKIVGNVQTAGPSVLSVVARPTAASDRSGPTLSTASAAGRFEVISRLRASGEFEVAVPSAGTWDVEILRGTSTLARISAVPISESTRLPDLCLGPDPQPCGESRELATFGDAYTWSKPTDFVPTKSLPARSTAIPQEIRLCLATAPPLHRVAGAIARWETDPGVFAVSDGEGCFRLPLSHDEDFLRVDKPGFHSLREPLTALVAGDRPPTMMAAAPVLALVVDGASKPIARARVSWQREGAQKGSTHRLSADDRGFFAFHSVSPGNYDVNVETDLDSTTRLVRVGPAGSTPRWETFVLSRESSVRGRVLHEDGSGVADATVALVPAGKSEIADRILLGHRRSLDLDGIYRAATSKAGDFRLSKVSAGTYALVIRSSFGALRRDDLVLPAEGLNLGELTLPRGPRLALRIVDSEDQPVEEIPVAIGTIRTGPRKYSVGHPSGPLTTDPDGRVVFEGLTPDSLIGIQIAVRGFAELQETLTVGEADVERTVRLEPGLEVCGRAFTALDGSALQGVRLTLRRADAEDFPLGTVERSDPEASSSVDGSFCLTASSTGPYTLIAEAGGFRRVEIALAVPTSGVEGQEVMFEIASSVRGHVTTAEGQPLSGAFVRLGSAGSRTDSEGAFEIQANEVGWLELGARHEDYGSVSRQVLVPEGVNVEENLSFPAGATVSGRVHSEAGDPIANAAVYLRSVDGAPSRARRATSEGSGAFGFENVPRGEYTLSARHRDIGRTETVTPLRVADDPVSADLVLRDGLEAPVEGRVDGLGARDTAVVKAEGPGTSMTSIVGSDGRFRFGSLQRGRWRLTLWVSGRPVAGATLVEIRGDEPSPLRVVLTNPGDRER